MIHDVLLFIIVGFAAILVQSFVGFGSALVAAPILLIFLPPSVAIPSFALAVLAMDVLLVIETRIHVDWRRVFALLAGGVVGSPIGAFALKTLPPGNLQIAVNLMVLLFAILLWCNIRVPLPDNRRTQAGVGLVSGFLGGCISTSGPPIVIFGLARRWEKDIFRGTLLAYFTGLALVSVCSYTVMGMVGRRNLILGAAGFAGAVPAAWIGVKLKNRVSQKLFSRIVLGLISLAALIGLAKQIFT